MASLSNQILAMAPVDIRVTRIIALEWQDGPTFGYLSVADPCSAWRFRLIAERFEEDDADSRLFVWNQVNWLNWERLESSLARHHEQGNSIWIPSYDSWAELQEESRGIALEPELAEGAPALVIHGGGTSVVQAWGLFGDLEFNLTSVTWLSAWRGGGSRRR